MNRRMTDEQAKKTYERALKMEQEFGEYFTGKTLISYKRNISLTWSPFRSHPSRHNWRDLQQNKANHLVAIRQGNLGAVERISMTTRYHNVDIAGAGAASACFEKSTISLKFINSLSRPSYNFTFTPSSDSFDRHANKTFHPSSLR